jgi:putative PIN family toxin of toxin-antitoxin system
VLDTSVIVAGFRSPSGASARLLNAALDGKITLVANVALFAEWESVLKRPDHVAATRKTLQAIDGLLDDLAAIVVPVEMHFSLRPQLADPDDEMVLEAAVSGAAEAIVTFETRTFSLAAPRFGLSVLTPAEAWARLKP